MPEAAISEYFYGDEAEQFIYFRIPRQLITDPRFKHLSTDAKLLYGMLLDRMSLSVKNGWYDEDGRVYIYYTVEEICGDMNCGRDKAMKMLADLDTKKGVGLIRRVKQGQGKPTKLYVKRFTTGSVPPQPAPPEQLPFTPFPGVDFSGVQKSSSPTSASRVLRRQQVGKADVQASRKPTLIILIRIKLILAILIHPSIPPAPRRGVDRRWSDTNSESRSKPILTMTI